MSDLNGEQVPARSVRPAGEFSLDDMHSCRAYVFGALVAAMTERDGSTLAWVENERQAVAVAANEWATSHGYPTITVDDVERVEGQAVGHVDYASKLALYVAEAVVETSGGSASS